MQPFFFFFLFFLSVQASGRISLSHGYSFMYERSEQHFHSLVLPGVLKLQRKPAEFSAFENTVLNLVGRTSPSILLTLQSPMATKLIWYNILKKTMKSSHPRDMNNQQIGCLKAHDCMSSKCVTLQYSSTYATL